MKRARHLAHALIGLILIAGAGWLLDQPYLAADMRHQGAKIAAAGVLIVLALFAVVSLAKAAKGGKPAAKRPGLPYAASGRK